jgi:tetratricopeptide (TPR) repeat protein
MSAAPGGPSARAWLAPALLALAVTVVYAPTLGAPFLAYDDDWLIEHDPVMRDASIDAVGAIVADLSRETRLVLGAEYLPVRDLVTWAGVRAFGMSAPALRVLLLALYLGAVLAWRAYFRRWLGATPIAELAAFAFALHPVHAESVAWLAGIKDVLALGFSGVALAAYAARPLDARTRVVIVTAVALACLSKAVSVVVPGLLLFTDAWLGRAPDRPTILVSAAFALAIAALDARVGAIVGMYAPMPGGDRLSALATMAPVAFRYLARVALLEPASIVYEVPDRSIGDPVALASLGGLVLLASIAVVLARRGERRPLLLLAFAALALAPVSQVLAPIQHRMADRYLLVALAAPCVGIALVIGGLESPRVRWPLAVAFLVLLAGATGLRARTLSDRVALWAETCERAPGSPVGPYQLGIAVERSQPDVAERAFREAMARDLGHGELWRRAADDLAILLTAAHRENEALMLLEAAHERFPNDPRVGHNLALLLDAAGQHERARALMLDVIRAAPRYERARTSYRSRWGEPPIPEPTRPRYDAGDRALRGAP